MVRCYDDDCTLEGAKHPRGGVRGANEPGAVATTRRNGAIIPNAVLGVVLGSALLGCGGTHEDGRDKQMRAPPEIAVAPAAAWGSSGKSSATHLWHWGPASESASGFEFYFVNGLAWPVANMPCAQCDRCSEGGHCEQSIVPYTLPHHLQSVLPKRPVSRAEYARLVQTILADPAFAGLEIDLPPGCRFAAFEWRVPTRPDFDVFWPDDTTLVSSRVAEALRTPAFRGMAMFPVTILHAGTMDARVRPLPDAAISDFGDMLERLPAMDKSSRKRLMFFSIAVPVVCGNVDWEAGTDHCKECRASITDEASEVFLDRISRYNDRHRSRKTIPRHETADTDAFRNLLHPGIIVTDKVHRTLLGLGLDNSSYEKLEVVDEPPEFATKEL